MIKPLHALLLRLKKLHVKISQEDRKKHVHFHIRKAITVHDILEKLLKYMYNPSTKDFLLWLIWKGLTHFMPMRCRGPLENATFHRPSSLPFPPSQRSSLKESGSGNRSGLS